MKFKSLLLFTILLTYYEGEAQNNKVTYPTSSNSTLLWPVTGVHISRNKMLYFPVLAWKEGPDINRYDCKEAYRVIEPK